MLVHTVVFYLKPELTPERRETFRRSLASLEGVPSIEAFYLGTPAAVAPRPVVDLGFDFSITCVFKDLAAHDAYQVHPLHQEFLASQRECWARVQIYDAQG